MASRAGHGRPGCCFGAGYLGPVGGRSTFAQNTGREEKKLEGCPPHLQKAARICRAVSSDLTGIAAVAGLAADEVLNEALRLGADRVILNNGGDIALKVSDGQPDRVGMKTHPEGEVTHFLEIAAEHNIGGVATSGWTGRSFSTAILKGGALSRNGEDSYSVFLGRWFRRLFKFRENR